MNGANERRHAANASYEEEDERGPQDWHAAYQREVAAENRSALSELPMNGAAINDDGTDERADMVSNRKQGTTNELFNLTSSEEEVYTNCARAEECSSKTPAESGIRGIEELLTKSLEALNVSKIQNLLP